MVDIGIEVIIYALMGGLGGLVRSVITGEGVIVLPKVHEGRVDLGVIASVIIGMFAGMIAPYSLGVDGVIAALAGYAGADFIENALERKLGKRGETT
jgi:hypothetical protein